MKWKTFVAGLVALWGSAASATTPTSIGPSVPSDVILESDRIYIRMDVIPNPDSCGSHDIIVLAAASPAELERMFSVLITSIASGKTVTIWINGRSELTPWGVTVPNAYDVQFHR